MIQLEKFRNKILKIIRKDFGTKSYDDKNIPKLKSQKHNK